MAAPAKLENIRYPAWFNKPLPLDRYSYRDYKKWDDDISAELLDGIPYMMASPNEKHQSIVSELHGQLWSQLKGKKCKVYSELDCRLFYEADESDKTVVRPDLIVVCDSEKVKGKANCEGAPDFVIEVVSKHSMGKDLIDKKNLYEQGGVKEYWVIDEKKVYRYELENGLYVEDISSLELGLKLQVKILDSLWLDFGPIAEEFWNN